MPQDYMKILRLKFSSLEILVFCLLLFCNHSSLSSQTPWNRGFTKEKSTLTRSSSNIRQFNVFNCSKHLLNTLRNSWALVILENKNKLLFCTETQNELIWFDSSRSKVFSLRLLIKAILLHNIGLREKTTSFSQPRSETTFHFTIYHIVPDFNFFFFFLLFSSGVKTWSHLPNYIRGFRFKWKIE